LYELGLSDAGNRGVVIARFLLMKSLP